VGQDALLLLQIAIQRRIGIRRQDMKRGAFQAVALDPRNSALEHIGSVVIKPQHEAAVHLDAVVVQDGDAACIVLRCWGAFAGCSQVACVE
jgi:hypothetical protein